MVKIPGRMGIKLNEILPGIKKKLILGLTGWGGLYGKDKIRCFQKRRKNNISSKK